MTASTASRQVRRLHLRAPDDTLAGRGARLIEDALRTASLPDAGAGMLLFRRLTLGRFGADVAPQTLSLALERRIAALRALAIHAAAPGAAQAPVVWFRDALEAHTLLALRIAEGEPAQEWFWPLVVPALQSSGGTVQGLRAVVHSLRRRPEAPIALPLLARALAQRGHADLLRAAVGAAQAAKLLHAATMEADIAPSACEAPAGAMHGVVSEGRDPDKHTASTPAVEVPPRVRHALSDDEVAPSPGSGPRRPVGAIRASALSSTAETDPIVDPAELRAAQWPTESRHVAPPAPQAVPFAASHARAAASAAPRRERWDDATVASARPAPPPPRSDGRAAAQPELTMHAPAPARAAHAQESGRLDQPPWPEAAPTAAGGLLFLLPVLARLGYERWLEDSPQWAPLAIDRRMLALVCARLALPPHDPAWRLCAAPALPSPERFCAPSKWDERIAACGAAWRRDATADGTRLWDGSGRLLLAAWPGRRRPAAIAPLLRGRRVVQCDVETRDADLTAAVTAAWLTACRRWLRRRARLGIATAVMRPARLSLTPTHADVFFDLNGVSLAVRRAGLDLDPGWVAGFGRVVAFHYERVPWT
jgi:hypothetical protein